ncbi:lytic transglycosylase domain-containing protein [Negadavirga shengliensis]|uniref:Lytic transglycosylase domain-containing protein n=1 Tax=Negadavirga shengliensis TaxID=1389218 RepID=A0ABV9T1C0_9BACT
MVSKHISVLYSLIGLLFLVIGFLVYERNNNGAGSWVEELEARPQAYFQEDKSTTFPRVRIFEIPERPVFAEEPVPIHLPDILERFERELYVNAYWESNTLLMMKRAGKFFPYIEKTLKENGIPEDFKYVALIESGLMNVVSPAGARGFWQLMEGTAKELGLEVNKEVDERYHFEKATIAASKYLRSAYGKFGNWTSVAASYNMGISGLTRRKNEQLSPDYYDLYLNEETSRYIFRILAMKAIFEHPGKYGFELQTDDLYKLPLLREINVTESIPDLAKWAVQNRSNYKELKLHNPWLRSDKLSVRKGQSYTIKLPV